MKLFTPRRVGPVVLSVLATLALTASPARAADPLPTPGTPVASAVTTNSVTLSWSAPAGPSATYTIQVIDGPLVPWYNLVTVSARTYVHTGLSPDKGYEYRVIANPVPGSGYTVSPPSGILYVTTAPLPDTVPPTRPGQPSAAASTVAATLTFATASDNNRVAVYWAQRQIGGVWTDWATNNIASIRLTDLTPATTYTVAVVAVDPNGNRSARSDPLTFTTRATQPAPTCRVQVVSFGSQYSLTVTVENMTAASVVRNWTVTFTLPLAHTVNYAFNVTLSRSGSLATATPAVYLSTIAPGTTISFGFNASYPAGSPLPSGFALNSPLGTIPCGPSSVSA